MKMYKDSDGYVTLDYQGQYPTQYIEIDIDHIKIKIENAKLNVNGSKGSLLDAIKAACDAFSIVRWGQFVDDGENSTYIGNIDKNGKNLDKELKALNVQNRKRLKK